MLFLVTGLLIPVLLLPIAVLVAFGIFGSVKADIVPQIQLSQNRPPEYYVVYLYLDPRAPQPILRKDKSGIPFHRNQDGALPS